MQCLKKIFKFKKKKKNSPKRIDHKNIISNFTKMTKLYEELKRYNAMSEIFFFYYSEDGILGGTELLMFDFLLLSLSKVFQLPLYTKILAFSS